LTQEEVAVAIGVARRSVYEWESGLRVPSHALPALAKLYDASVTLLLYGVEPASVELRTLHSLVERLALDVSETRTALLQLAEQTEALFAEVRRLLELNDG